MPENTLFYFTLLAMLCGSALLMRRIVGKTKLIIFSVFFFSVMIYLLIFAAADYFTGEGINDAVLYHLRYGLGGAGFEEYSLLIFASILTILISFLFIIGFRVLRIQKRDGKRLVNSSVLPSALVAAAVVFSPTTAGLLPYVSFDIRDNEVQTQQFSQNYENTPIKQTAEKPKNLVYIYAESLERSYFEENVFPELITELRDLESIATTFTQIHQVRKTGWTIGGIVASQCGIPLITPSHGNSMGGMDAFLPTPQCLGDSLSEAGYELSVFNGSSLEFSGLKKFFVSHGFDNIYGLKELTELLDDKNYVNSWGLYDDSVFKIALDKFYDKSSGNKPFGLFISTMDTHHPKGHVSSLCEGEEWRIAVNPVLNAVKCSDRLIGNFIRQIISSEYADDTVIVITSDHLAMRNTATHRLERVPERRNLFMVIEPSKIGERIDRKGSMLDVASTILPYLGFSGNIGLGRNLSDNQSLLSTITNFDSVLASWDKEIVKLWDFPEIRPTDSLYVDSENNSIKFKRKEFRYPLLIEFEDDYSSTVRFQFDASKEHKKLSEHFFNLEQGVPFLWIDSCSVMSKFKVENFSEVKSGTNCLMYGKQGFKDNTFSTIVDDEVILGSNIFFPEHKFVRRTQQELFDNSRDVARFIAHAGGAIDGYTYTNSLEALNNSYDHGFRVFELDIIKTREGVYVAAHGWEHWAKLTGFEGEIPPTLEIFRNHLIHKKFTPLDIHEINRWFLSHPDAILVTDKVNDPLNFSELFVDKNRLIMELFSLDAVAEGAKSGIRSAMPTWSILKQIEGDIVEKLRDLDVSHIAASRRIVEKNIPLIRRLKDEGIKVYVFHVNLDEGKDEEFVVCNEMNYVYGLYADYYDFTEPADCINFQRKDWSSLSVRILSNASS